MTVTLSLFDQLPSPIQPEPAPIHEIHRGHDGFIHFSRKDRAGKFSNLEAIPANKLDGMFPAMSPLLDEDAFFSLNGFFNALRRSEGVRWLTCCFTDIDFHTLGITHGNAFGQVVDMVDADEIPPPSIYVNSGRGLWLMWLLIGDDHGNPVRAWPENLRAWSEIEREVITRLSRIGADSNASDVSRITRVPGSINSKSQTRVKYHVPKDAAGKSFLYSLDDLVQFFDITIKVDHPKVREKLEHLSERGAKGQAGRWKFNYQDFMQLWSIRGTFQEGTRNHAVMVFTTILRYQAKSTMTDVRLSDADILKEVDKLIATFPQRTPFTRTDRDAAMKGAGKMPLRNQTISDWLDITPDEAEFLEKWEPATRFGTNGAKADPSLSRAEARAVRISLIRELVGNRGGLPPLREIKKHLADYGFEGCSLKTIQADLEKADLVNPRDRKRKKRRSNQRNMF